MYSIAYLFKKILFPVHCIVCKKGDRVLCPYCKDQIQVTTRILKHPRCTEMTFLQYQHKSVARIIWELKYKNNRALRAQIVAYLTPTLLHEIAYLLPDTKTPIYCISVPKTKYDQKKRDFDHGELLMREFAKHIPYPYTLVTRCLIKENKKRQVEHTHRVDRISAAKNSVQTTPRLGRFAGTPSPLLIFDDVTTTGATRDEMIRVLKQTFIGPIIFIALAH